MDNFVKKHIRDLKKLKKQPMSQTKLHKQLKRE